MLLEDAEKLKINVDWQRVPPELLTLLFLTMLKTGEALYREDKEAVEEGTSKYSKIVAVYRYLVICFLDFWSYSEKEKEYDKHHRIYKRGLEIAQLSEEDNIQEELVEQSDIFYNKVTEWTEDAENQLKMDFMLKNIDGYFQLFDNIRIESAEEIEEEEDNGSSRYT